MIVNNKPLIIGIPPKRFFLVDESSLELLSDNTRVELLYSEEMIDNQAILSSILDREENRIYAEMIDNGFCKTIIDLLVLSYFNVPDIPLFFKTYLKLREVLAGSVNESYMDYTLSDLLSCSHGFFVSRKQYIIAMNRMTGIPESACNIIRRELAKTPSIPRLREERERIIKKVIVSQVKEKGEKIYDVFFNASKIVTSSIVHQMNFNMYQNYLASYCKYKYPEIFATTIGLLCK